MFRKLNAWVTIATGIGSAARGGRQIDVLFRYFILETLEEEGFFTYLQQPCTYGQILAEFNFVDSDYTREMMNILAEDKNNTIIREGDMYRVNPEVALPKLEDLVSSTDQRLKNFEQMARGMVGTIPLRLRNQPIEFSESFEADGRQLLSRFDTTLGSKVYTTLRNAAFALLTGEDKRKYTGSKLLNVGCGSGRETAELWLKANGQIYITAIDPVASMLEVADQKFETYLKEINLNHPAVTEINRPIFKEASATRLPYDDNTFDFAFHSQVLHWTPNPEQVISEIVRVVKPGGVVFGTQAVKGILNPFFDLVIRTSENSYGGFWKEEFFRWYQNHGVRLETATPVLAFRGQLPL